jgi:hypothetical protein
VGSEAEKRVVPPGLTLFFLADPALKRWAKVACPFGTGIAWLIVDCLTNFID